MPIIQQDTSRIIHEVGGIEQTIEGLQQTVESLEHKVQSMSMKFDELVMFMKSSSNQQAVLEDLSISPTPIANEIDLQKMEDNLMLFDRNLLPNDEFKSDRQKLVRFYSNC